MDGMEVVGKNGELTTLPETPPGYTFTRDGGHDSTLFDANLALDKGLSLVHHLTR